MQVPLPLIAYSQDTQRLHLPLGIDCHPTDTFRCPRTATSRPWPRTALQLFFADTCDPFNNEPNLSHLASCSSLTCSNEEPNSFISGLSAHVLIARLLHTVGQLHHCEIRNPLEASHNPWISVKCINLSLHIKRYEQLYAITPKLQHFDAL